MGHDEKQLMKAEVANHDAVTATSISPVDIVPVEE
jgi:hypothetical protein